MNRAALIELKDKVEAGSEFDWGFCENPARLAFPVMWDDAMQAYQGSLDAAKALHEAVLPGWFWAVDEHDSEVSLIGRNSNGKCVVRQTFPVTHEGNPARAWLIAILSALIAMETDREEERETEEGY